jgi:hypothetical protein
VIGNAASTSLLPMAENVYTLGLGRVDVASSNVKTDVLVTLDIIGAPGSTEPYAGLVSSTFTPLFSFLSFVWNDC